MLSWVLIGLLFVLSLPFAFVTNLPATSGHFAALAQIVCLILGVMKLERKS